MTYQDELAPLNLSEWTYDYPNHWIFTGGNKVKCVSALNIPIQANDNLFKSSIMDSKEDYILNMSGTADGAFVLLFLDAETFDFDIKYSHTSGAFDETIIFTADAKETLWLNVTSNVTVTFDRLRLIHETEDGIVCNEIDLQDPAVEVEQQVWGLIAGNVSYSVASTMPTIEVNHLEKSILDRIITVEVDEQVRAEATHDLNIEIRKCD